MYSGIKRRSAALLLSALMILVIAAPAGRVSAEKNLNPGVLPPNAHPYGHTYAEWAGIWWQWVFSIPTPDNPFVDPTGGNCAQGQSGPVWFLVGYIGDPTTPSCTIPPGKAILFPIVNVECSVAEPDPFHGDNEAELRTCANGWMDGVTGVDASLDGVPLTGLFDNHRFESPLFTFTYPEDNVLALPGPGSTQSVADGFYVMLTPLSPGQHELKFQATGNLPVDVTYTLTIGH